MLTTLCTTLFGENGSTDNFFDMYAAIYKKTLDEVLADPEDIEALVAPPTG